MKYEGITTDHVPVLDTAMRSREGIDAVGQDDVERAIRELEDGRLDFALEVLRRLRTIFEQVAPRR